MAETVIEFLQRRLREVGPDQWPQIVAATGVAQTLPRKVAYGDRPNPGVNTIQPLLNYFDELDRRVQATKSGGDAPGAGDRGAGEAQATG